MNSGEAEEYSLGFSKAAKEMSLKPVIHPAKAAPQNNAYVAQVLDYFLDHRPSLTV